MLLIYYNIENKYLINKWDYYGFRKNINSR